MKRMWAVFKKSWKFIILLFLLLLTFSYAMFQGGFVSWFLFYSFLPFAIYGLGLSFYSLGGFEVRREISKTDYFAGEPLQVKVTIKRNSAFPLFYAIIDDLFDEKLQASPQKKKAKALLLPGFKREFSYHYVIDEMPRGEHILQGFSIRIGDLLGLIEKEKTIPLETRLLVYPAYSELHYRPYENHFDQGMTASRERVQRDTTMATGVRDYQPGDRFSWINWKATAKRNDIMTKEFEQRQSHDVMVVMDGAPDPRFETVVSFTASLLHAVLKKGAQAGLLTVTRERGSFPIRGGETQWQELLYHLAKIEATSPVSFEKVLEMEGLFVQQTVSIYLVTSQLSKPLLERAGFLGQRKGKVTIFFAKGAKEGPSPSERALITQANARGIRVVVVNEGLFESAFSEVNYR